MPELFAFAALDAGIGAEAVGLGAAEAGFGAADAGLGAAEAGFGAADAGLGAAEVGFNAADAGLGAADAGIGSVEGGLGGAESGLGGGLDTGLGGGGLGSEFGGATLAPGIQSLPGIGTEVGGELSGAGLGGETVAAQIGSDLGPTSLINATPGFNAAGAFVGDPFAQFVDPSGVGTFANAPPQLAAGFTPQDLAIGETLQSNLTNFQIPGFQTTLTTDPALASANANALAAAGEAAEFGAGIETAPIAADTATAAAPGIAVDTSGLGASLGLADTPAEIASAAQGFGPLPSDVFGSPTSSLTGASPAASGIGVAPTGGFISPETALGPGGTGSISDVAAGDALGGGNAPIEGGGGPAAVSPNPPPTSLGESNLGLEQGNQDIFRSGSQFGTTTLTPGQAAVEPVLNPAAPGFSPADVQPEEFGNVGRFAEPRLLEPAPISPANVGGPFEPGVTPNVPNLIQPEANTFQQLGPATDTIEASDPSLTPADRGAGAFATPDLLGSAPISPPDVGSPFATDLTQQQFISNSPVENFGFTDIQNAAVDPNVPGGFSGETSFGADLSQPDFGLGQSTIESNLGVASNTGIFPSGTDSFGFSGATDVASTPDLFGDIETGPQVQLGGAYNQGFPLQAGDVTWNQPGSAIEQGIAPVSSQNIGPFDATTTPSPAGVGAPDIPATGTSVGTGLSGGQPMTSAAADSLSNPFSSLLPKGGFNVGQLAGLGAAGFLLSQQPKVPSATNAAIANANQLNASGQQLVAQTAPTPLQQAAIDKVKQDAENQLRQQYFAQGRDPNADTSFAQQSAAVATQTAALAAAFVQQANQLGLSEVSSANATLTAAGQQQLAVQQAFNQALLNVSLSLARLFAPSAGSFKISPA